MAKNAEHIYIAHIVVTVYELPYTMKQRYSMPDKVLNAELS